MSATYRYTGANAVILFNGVTISNDFTELTIEYKQRVEDKTAGNDTDQSVTPTIKEGKATLKRFDTILSDGGIATALKIGTLSTLEIRPMGTTLNYPVQSFLAVVTNFKMIVIFDKTTYMQVDFVKTGIMIKDIGATQ